MKNSFMHYMKQTRLILPVAFKEFELVCTFLLFLSIHHCQLVKVNFSKNLEGVLGPVFTSVGIVSYKILCF